jgi:hypothetical protein
VAKDKWHALRIPDKALWKRYLPNLHSPTSIELIAFGIRSRRDALPLAGSVGRCSPGVGAASLQTLETFPAANAVIDPRSNGSFVRFDKPIDHVRSLLLIKRGNRVVETLQPRLEAAPEVLFARAPTLPPGDYTLHWLVRTLADVVDGEISFKIAASPRTDLGILLRLASNLRGSPIDLDH